MLEFLWGLKTISIFDVWSIKHFITGVCIGNLIINRKKGSNLLQDKFKLTKNKKTLIFLEILILLIIIYFWELAEYLMEIGLLGNAVEYWFQGVEFWPNRMIADPILLAAGYILSRRNQRFIKASKIFSFIWLFVHIFIFPHSMYLHYIF